MTPKASALVVKMSMVSLGLLLLLAAMVAGLAMGSSGSGLDSIWTSLFSGETGRTIEGAIVWRLRFPRVRLVERAPYFPPAIRSLPDPPPPLPPAPPKPALKRPAVKPLPVVNAPKPIARKPPETSVPAQPPPVPAVPEAELQSPPPPAAPDPAHMSTDLPLSPPYSPLPVPSVDSHHAAPAEKSSTDSAVVMATPRYRDNPPPAYPSIARKRGYEGTVVLDVFVDQNGRVGRLRVAESSSFRLLDRSAIRAVEGWQFEPGRR